jgi:hypothetical protein
MFVGFYFSSHFQDQCLIITFSVSSKNILNVSDNITFFKKGQHKGILTVGQSFCDLDYFINL